MPDKLIGFKSDLVQGNEGWQEWSFRQLLRAIKHWMDMNPATQANESETQPREPAYIPKGKNIKNEELSGERSYQTREDIGRQIHGCVSCDKIGYFSAKKLPKNYLSWRSQTILSHLQAVEATDVTTFNASIIHLFVTRQTMRVSEDFWLHRTMEQAGSFILLFWSKLMESNALHSLTLEQAVHVHPLPLHEQFNHIEMTLGSVNKLRPSVLMEWRLTALMEIFGWKLKSQKWIVGPCYHLKTQNTLKLSRSTPILQEYR